MQLWHKVSLGLVLGVAFGYFCPEYAPHIKFMGDIFLRGIKMVIGPLIFCTLIVGICNMSDPSTLGRVGIKATLAFLGTTCFAVIFGLSLAILLKPGVGAEISFGYPYAAMEAESFSIVEFLVKIIPDNAVKPFVDGELLQIVFMSMFTAVILVHMGSYAVPIVNFFNLTSKVVFKMISVVIELSPYAAFSLTAWVISQNGVDLLLSLSKLIAAVMIAMSMQYGIFGIMIKIFCKVSPMPFYRKSIEYQLLAFSTSSSKATLPTTMKVCNQNLGISSPSTSFILPLGASINMNGLAINLSLTTIFFAQMLNVSLCWSDYLVIILTSTLGSIGGAGIPGASLIMLPMVLQSVNLPIEGVAIIAGIDRILDMFRSTINITGDAAMTMIIDHSEGSFDKETYFS